MTELVVIPAIRHSQHAKHPPPMIQQQFDLRTQLLCTPLQAQQALGVGTTMLYQLLADGSIRSIKIGKARRIIVESLHEFVSDMESYNFGELKGGK